MKIFNQIKSGFAKVALAVLLASPLAVSCYDDSALQEQIDMIVDQLFELEQKMNSEIKALFTQRRQQLQLLTGGK